MTFHVFLSDHLEQSMAEVAAGNRHQVGMIVVSLAFIHSQYPMIATQICINVSQIFSLTFVTLKPVAAPAHCVVHCVACIRGFMLS